MCARPTLLCLDEPAAGLNPRESAGLNELLAEIREREKIGILLIEHDMSVVMGVSDQIVVLDHGKRIAAGTPQSVRRDPAVIKAYLGEDESAPLPPEIAADLGQQEARMMLEIVGLEAAYGQYPGAARRSISPSRRARSSR